MSMAARMAASISRCVVSSKCASGACFRGATARLAVAFVALEDVGQHRGLVDLPALRPVFGCPAAGAHFRRRGDENLNVGIGTDDGADIAAVEHGAGRLGGEVALKGEQRRAHLGMAETIEAASPTAWRLERGFVEARRIERLGGGDRGGLVVRAAAGIEQRFGHRAIDQPGVEMAQAVMRGEPLAERALARAAGPSMAMIMSSPRRASASVRRSPESWWR